MGLAQGNGQMSDVFFQIRELIERLYEWFRKDRNGRNSILLSKLLAENCESTLMSLFGSDALENVQLAFLDLSVLSQRFDTVGVQCTAQTADLCITKGGAFEHFQMRLVVEGRQNNFFVDPVYPQ